MADGVMGGRRSGKTVAMLERKLGSLPPLPRLPMVAIDPGFEQHVSRLHRPGVAKAPTVRHIDIHDLEPSLDHMRDALLYGRGAMQTNAIPENALKKHTNAELIHEMLERGFAVMKIPERKADD